MNGFKEKLLRLKNELKNVLDKTTDKEIAAILDMKPTAFAERKKTESFPEKELFALKAKRPDLNLDMDYILLGHRREVYETMEKEALKDMPKLDDPLFAIERNVGQLTAAENLLIQYFRFMSGSSQQTLMNVATAMVRSQLAPTFSDPITRETVMHIQSVNQQNNIEHFQGEINFKKEK